MSNEQERKYVKGCEDIQRLFIHLGNKEKEERRQEWLRSKSKEKNWKHQPKGDEDEDNS